MKYNSTLLRHFRKPAHAAELLVDSAAAVDAEVFADSVALAAVDGSAEHLLRVSAGSYDQGAMVVLFIVWQGSSESGRIGQARFLAFGEPSVIALADALCAALEGRSEEHTSELQSRGHLVCRLLLEKKKGTPSDK